MSDKFTDEELVRHLSMRMLCADPPDPPCPMCAEIRRRLAPKRVSWGRVEAAVHAGNLDGLLRELGIEVEEEKP